MSEDRKSAAERFWEQPIGPTQRWLDKYRELESLAACIDEDERKERMRSISRRWPGALREAELVHPQRLHLRALRAEGLEPTCRRGDLLESAELGFFLAAQLNQRLDSLQRMRARARTQRRDWDLVGEIERSEESERQLWPDSASGAGLEGLSASVRLAYLSLAWTCGASLPLLNAIIFERRGSWDEREGDPPWAREPGPREELLARALADLR